MSELRGFATVLFGGLVDKYGDQFVFIRDNLPASNINVPFRTYISWTIFVTLVSFVISAVVTPIVLTVNGFGIPLVIRVVMMVLIPVIIAASTFLYFFFYPAQVAGSRRKNMESNLPFALTHMGAVAESGVPPYVIFKLIGEFDEYGEIAKEMRKIVKNIDTFGLDPLSAVKEVAKKTPSQDFKQILMGFVTTTESGGDLRLFLKSTSEQALFNWRIKRQRFLEQLSMYAEFYTGVLIAAPLFLISLFAVMALIQPNLGGINILTLSQMSIYGLIPLTNIVFLIFLKGVEVEI
ncbi:MAG: type II secretion system F family protein [Candidatus Aenigmarchaeota archaeon]|nr:type II secretion system F family protein [Candidatus Aenigmarchaeota archaeon]